MLKCPFDETKVFCGGEDLEAKCKNAGYGIYDATGTDQCIIGSVKVLCPYSLSYYKCREKTAAEKCEEAGYQQIICQTGYYASATYSYDTTYVNVLKILAL